MVIAVSVLIHSPQIALRGVLTIAARCYAFSAMPAVRRSRIENRMGEPSANPYLYILSQIVTGLDGIESGYDPASPETDPYTTDHKLLPKTLASALDFLERDKLFKDALGSLFIDYYLKIKRTELGRFRGVR